MKVVRFKIRSILMRDKLANILAKESVCPKDFGFEKHPCKYEGLLSACTECWIDAFEKDCTKYHIPLPCAIGTKLYRVTQPYRQPAKVTEYTVKNFRTIGKKHRLQLEVQATNVPGTNWMPFDAFHTTREAAEEELALLTGGQK